MNVTDTEVEARERQRHEIELAESSFAQERIKLGEKVSANYFAKSFLPAVLFPCLFVFLPQMGIHPDLPELPRGIIGGILVLIWYGSGIASFWFVGKFLFEWLAIITIKTPARFQRVVHVAVALALPLALMLTMNTTPLAGVKATWVYVEYHGFFAFKLVLMAAMSGWIAFVIAKTATLSGFPRYPLRWSALILVASVFIGASVRPEETSSPFSYFAREAHILGPVLFSYLGFVIGAKLGSYFRNVRLTTLGG